MVNKDVYIAFNKHILCAYDQRSLTAMCHTQLAGGTMPWSQSEFKTQRKSQRKTDPKSKMTHCNLDRLMTRFSILTRYR